MLVSMFVSHLMRTMSFAGGDVAARHVLCESRIPCSQSVKAHVLPPPPPAGGVPPPGAPAGAEVTTTGEGVAGAVVGVTAGEPPSLHRPGFFVNTVASGSIKPPVPSSKGFVPDQYARPRSPY